MYKQHAIKYIIGLAIAGFAFSVLAGVGFYFDFETMKKKQIDDRVMIKQNNEMLCLLILEEPGIPIEKKVKFCTRGN